MTVEFGNWSELQGILSSSSPPEEVSKDYVWQKNEIAYTDSMTYTHTGLWQGHIPTEVEFMESFRKQLLEQQGAKLLYAKLTITKTMIGIQYGRAYYKVDAKIENCYIQADPLVLVLFLALIVVLSGSIVLTFIAVPGTWWRFTALVSGDLDEYVETWASKWEQVVATADMNVAIVSAALVGLGAIVVWRAG